MIYIHLDTRIALVTHHKHHVVLIIHLDSIYVLVVALTHGSSTIPCVWFSLSTIITLMSFKICNLLLIDAILGSAHFSTTGYSLDHVVIGSFWAKILAIDHCLAYHLSGPLSIESRISCILFLYVSECLASSIWLILNFSRRLISGLGYWLCLIQHRLSLIVGWQDLRGVLVVPILANSKILLNLTGVVQHGKALRLILGCLLSSYHPCPLSTLTSSESLIGWDQLRQVPLLLIHIVFLSSIDQSHIIWNQNFLFGCLCSVSVKLELIWSLTGVGRILGGLRKILILSSKVSLSNLLLPWKLSCVLITWMSPFCGFVLIRSFLEFVNIQL